MTFLSSQFLTPNRVSRWLRARSVSEGMKSEIYRFCADAAPYEGSGASAKLHKKIIEIQRPHATLRLNSRPTHSRAVTARPLVPGRLRRGTRAPADRLYRPQARANAMNARRFRALEAAAGALATVLAALTTASDGTGLGAWVAVVTTVGAAFAAHSAASRFDLQASTYAATARQLQDLEFEWKLTDTQKGPSEWFGFVAACEEVISAENRAWMAKLDEPTPSVSEIFAKPDLSKEGPRE